MNLIVKPSMNVGEIIITIGVIVGLIAGFTKGFGFFNNDGGSDDGSNFYKWFKRGVLGLVGGSFLVIILYTVLFMG